MLKILFIFLLITNKKMNDKIVQRLKKNRPSLTDSSLKTYSSILMNLYRRLDGKGDELKFFQTHQKQILSYLKDEKQNIRKTKLAVLISLLGDDALPEIRTVMLEDANAYNQSLRAQKKTDKQEQNWISLDEVKKVYRDLENRVRPFSKNTTYTKKQFNEMLDYVILSLYVLIPPRRSQDFTDMKFKDYDTTTDNYFNGKQFVFQRYKTSKIYHKQEFNVPLKLRKILLLWSRHVKTAYVLSSFEGTRISVSRLTMILNRIFGKKVSTTMLRHIFISDGVLKDVPALSKLDEISKEINAVHAIIPDPAP
jgi:hypothetical protein